MTEEEKIQENTNNHIIREIVGLEMEYFVEKRNVKTERRKKLRELIERHTKQGDHVYDS